MTTEENFFEISKTADRVRDLYVNNLLEDLHLKCGEISAKMKKIVDANAKDFNLVLANDSCKEVKLYELSSRVKEKDSLREKIIRDELFYHMLSKDEKELEDIILKRVDDLIGLRFLVSLTCDCYSIAELIKKYNNEFALQGIIFYSSDFKSERMKNGREIYRFKGTYEKYPFELQIKSKVDSAWADIEHMLFYKEFNFSYIQGTNRAVMNKIGDLLEQVDKLMVEVRNSQESYEDKVDELEFNHYLRKRYVNLVRDKLGSAFVLTEQRDVLLGLFTKYENLEKKNIIYLKDIPKEKAFLEFDMNEEVKNSILYKNYIKIKEYSIELRIFESIYYEWISHIKGDYFKLNEEDISKFLSKLCIETVSCYLGDADTHITNIQVYANWFMNIILSILKNDEFEVDNKLFIFDKKVMEMIAFYWLGRCKQLLMVEDIEEDIIKLDEVIIKSILDKKNEEKYSDQIKNIIDESENEKANILLLNLRGLISELYSSNDKNKSGKKKPTHCVVSLLDKSLEKIKNGGK